jgi:hypothetical protein
MMSTKSSCTFFSRLRHALAASLLLLPVVATAGAHAEPGFLVPVRYATAVNFTAGLATFTIGFDRTPEFFNVADPALPGDDFQFWTDTVSTEPIESTYAGLFGTGPLGTQMMVTTTAIRDRNQVTLVWPQLLTDPGPKDPGGWGSVEAYADYTLTDDNTLSFDVPLALLRAPDGRFNYVFETFQYAAGGYIDYYGVSGQAYPVPEPSMALLFAAGMALLAPMRRRGGTPVQGVRR